MENVYAIQIQGICRNQTKIGVQDGQSEDLINLRFRDGSWRASGDGRRVYNDTVGYTNLYLHTNVYRHLIGMRDGSLYWFANIDADGVTFEDLDEPQLIADVNIRGTNIYTQTGNILVVSTDVGLRYFVYSEINKTYSESSSDTNSLNGLASDRNLYPYGYVKFGLKNGNWDFDYDKNEESEKYINNILRMYRNCGGSLDAFYDHVAAAYSRAHHYPMFIDPFLACVALKTYDGKYIRASQQVLLYPRERVNDPGYYMDGSDKQKDGEKFRVDDNGDQHQAFSLFAGKAMEFNDQPIYCLQPAIDYRGRKSRMVKQISDTTLLPTIVACATNAAGRIETPRPHGCHIYIAGSQLTLELGDYSRIKEDELIDSLCIFITPQAQAFRTDLHSFHSSSLYKDGYTPLVYGCEVRSEKDIVNELTHYPMCLLREYKKVDLPDNNGDTIDVEIPFDLVDKLIHQDRLDSEAFERDSIVPNYCYSYNGRLHIADYLTSAYHGFPIDTLTGQNLANYGQYDSSNAVNLIKIDNTTKLPTSDSQRFLDAANTYRHAMLQIIVKIRSAKAETQVVRYIEPTWDAIGGEKGNEILNLGAMVSYPNADAYEMEIRAVTCNDTNVIFYKNTIPLNRHPLYNIAYYINVDGEYGGIRPIKLEQVGTMDLATYTANYETGNNDRPAGTGDYIIQAEVGEQSPSNNVIKVSNANNPLVFDYEPTEQIGSGRVIAMCSNTLEVGTGQNGEAPLYVFCTDGIYALYVNTSGEIVYDHAKPLSRDVCNNPRSVTPIDAGVVFTTDRGLFIISGEKVEELGAPAEGDVLRFTDEQSNSFLKSAKGALNKVARLPEGICDNIDFLTYLKDGDGAILNYNHADRELIVSNPKYRYSYVMDYERNWSRRFFTADEYVNNFPTSYRVDDGHFYKVDEEGDADTPLEQRKEADNNVFWLSHIIKLSSIGFKQLHRMVLRGFFEAKKIIRTLLDNSLSFSDYWHSMLDRNQSGEGGKLICRIQRAFEYGFESVFSNNHKEQATIMLYYKQRAQDDMVESVNLFELSEESIAKIHSLNQGETEFHFSMTINNTTTDINENRRYFRLKVVTKNVQRTPILTIERTLNSNTSEKVDFTLKGKYFGSDFYFLYLDTWNPDINPNTQSWPQTTASIDVSIKLEDSVDGIPATSNSWARPENILLNTVDNYFCTGQVNLFKNKDLFKYSRDRKHEYLLNTPLKLTYHNYGQYPAAFVIGVKAVKLDSNNQPIHLRDIQFDTIAPGEENTVIFTIADKLPSDWDKKTQDGHDYGFTPTIGFVICGVCSGDPTKRLDDYDMTYTLSDYVKESDNYGIMLYDRKHNVNIFEHGILLKDAIEQSSEYQFSLHAENTGDYPILLLLKYYRQQEYLIITHYLTPSNEPIDSHAAYEDTFNLSFLSEYLKSITDDSQLKLCIVPVLPAESDGLPADSNGQPIDYDREYSVDIRLEYGRKSEPYIGAYVFGSYDGRKFARIGGNEKQGTMTDIGCNVNRNDVRFIRLCFAGELSGQSRIEYAEISSKPSMLNTKIR